MVLLDTEKFLCDVKEIEQKLQEGSGPADLSHFKRLVWWINFTGITGILLLSAPVYYVLPSIMISIWTFSRWSIVAHHVSHGGYREFPHKAKKFSRKVFAKKNLWRRTVDWLDWISPEAWDVEHNHLHHYKLNEINDPDFVERNLRDLRASKVPRFLKYAAVLPMAMTWKWFYYAPNTFVHKKINEWKEIPQLKQRAELYEKTTCEKPWTIGVLLVRDPPLFVEFICCVTAPYFLFRFLFLPLFTEFVFGPQGWANALANVVVAEILTNVHSFVVIVPNHAGEDLYCYNTPVKPRSAEFYLRAIVSSANYTWGGNEVGDFMYGWLNYQIEHHMWPHLTMLQYRKARPLVKELCKKHNLPYVEENVLVRLYKTVNIMVGKTNMKKFPGIVGHEDGTNESIVKYGSTIPDR